MLAYAVVAHNPAADAIADENHVLPDWFAEDQVVKGRDAIQFLRRHHQKLGQVPDAFIRDPASVMLDNPQRINADSSILRVVLQLIFNFPSFILSKHCSLSLPLSPLSPLFPLPSSLSPFSDPHQPAQNRYCPGLRADRAPIDRD